MWERSSGRGGRFRWELGVSGGQSNEKRASTSTSSCNLGSPPPSPPPSPSKRRGKVCCILSNFRGTGGAEGGSNRDTGATWKEEWDAGGGWHLPPPPAFCGWLSADDRCRSSSTIGMPEFKTGCCCCCSCWCAYSSSPTSSTCSSIFSIVVLFLKVYEFV